LTTLHNQICKEGSLRQFNGSVYKNDEGKVLGIVIVARDVTKQAFALRSILEASLDLLLLSMPKGKSLTEIMH
jgi:hypothetical protein